ncbi:MAG: hypothetical protein GY810_23310 [Aureispira sp.]|nr:hypothetical protein [Aureispira sp.]
MKKVNVLFIICVALLWGQTMQAQGVGVNEDNSSPDASAMLDVKSSTKGMLIPRMTTGQRTVIATPATGLLVFDSDTGSFWFYDGSAWTELVSGGTDKDEQDLSLSGNNLSLTNDASPVDLSGYLDNTDNQDLSLAGNTLSLTNDGTTVDLSGFVNTDNQDLSLSGNTLSLTNDGTTVNLSGYLDNTDNQALSLAGNTLGLVNGGSVSLASYLDNTDNQDLSLAGNTLSLTNDGTTVDLSGFVNTDNQDLSLSGNILSLTNDGTTVDLSSFLDADNLGNHTATTTLNMVNNNITNVNLLSTRAVVSYDKLRVWNSSNYTIGMNNAMTFGYLNDYAMTFTMNQDDDRGWIWRDVNDAKSDGAASLTTDGRFVTKSILESQGELIVATDATIDGTTFNVDATNNRVGIGTATPGAGALLHINGGDILMSSTRFIEVQDGDQNIQLDDANPTWNGLGYGGVTRFYGDGTLASSKLEAGGLQLERHIQIKGGNPAAGRVLTSDATGNGSWTDPFEDKMVLSSSFAYSEDDVSSASLTNYGVLSGDDVSVVATLPFTVTLGGTAYTSLYISSNGFVEFAAGTGGTDLSNDALPSANHSNPLVAGYWDDLVSEGDNIQYGYTGTAPNRVFIVSYDARRFGGSDIVDFQIQIHEGSNLINVKYFDVSPNTCGQGATIGYQGAGGSAATAYPLGYNARLLDDNRTSTDTWSVCPVR